MSRSKLVVWITLVTVCCLLMVVPSYGAQSNALITAEELNGIVNSEGMVVIDVRNAEAYNAAHIPGAVSVQTSEFYEERDGVKNMAAGPEKFSALLSRIGVSKESLVVIYSAGNDFKHASRLWWTLHMYGHQNARLLDGGINAWIAAGYDVSTDPATPTPAEYSLTAGDVVQDTLATTEEVKALLGTATIIDCRDADYHQGEKYKAARSGHIAGTSLINESDNYNSDGTLKSADELAEIYTAKGITADTKVITYCNTGTTSTVQYFVLTQVLGYTDVQNYDASLTGWAADPDLPMESDYDYFTIGSGTAEVNAAPVELPAAPFFVDGSTFLPAETLALSLGVDLAELVKPGDKIVDQDGVNCVPVRFTAENYGAEVIWDGASKKVSIYLP